MIGMDAIAITLRRVRDVLDRAGVNYHCTGGLVSSLYGEPRFTQDVDIVLGIGEEDPREMAEKLSSLLSADFFFDAASIKRALSRNDMFQALDTETNIKVDFHVGESVPGELERSSPQPLLPGVSIRTVSREDAILSKLLWVRQGSQKSRRDVVMMLRASVGVDRAGLASKASRLGVEDLLAELEKFV